MDGDRCGDGDTERRVVDRRHEGGDPLGEVVDTDDQSGHQPHAHQLTVTGAAVHLLDRVHLVRILERGHQPVDDADQQDAAEKAGDRRRDACRGAPLGREQRLRFGEQLDERDVDHHAGRKTQRKREETYVGAVREKRDGAADTGRETGQQRQQQRKGYR